MDDESSSLKLKLYFFSSEDAEQWKDQRQISVEEKEDGNPKGRPTHSSGMTTRRNPYVLKIKPAEFSEWLGTDKQFLERKSYEGDDKKNPV